MQLARGFFLSPEKNGCARWPRSPSPSSSSTVFPNSRSSRCTPTNSAGAARQLFDRRLWRSAQAFFGKDARQLDLPECALLAGIIQSPNRLNPFRHPERAIERRNLVLDSMVETGAITKEQAEQAKTEPLHLVPSSVDASEAPYFVDLVHDRLQQKLGDRDFNHEGLHIYTSLDPDLQRLGHLRRRLHSSRDRRAG